MAWEVTMKNQPTSGSHDPSNPRDPRAHISSTKGCAWFAGAPAAKGLAPSKALAPGEGAVVQWSTGVVFHGYPPKNFMPISIGKMVMIQRIKGVDCLIFQQNIAKPNTKNIKELRNCFCLRTRRKIPAIKMGKSGSIRRKLGIDVKKIWI